MLQNNQNNVAISANRDTHTLNNNKNMPEKMVKLKNTQKLIIKH